MPVMIEEISAEVENTRQQPEEQSPPRPEERPKEDVRLLLHRFEQRRNRLLAD